MSHQDEAIFLRKTKFGESGFILSLLTKEQGVQSFILQGIKGPKKGLVAALHPLAILDIEFSENRKGKLLRLTQANLVESLQELRNDLFKGSIAYFLAEIIWKSLPENEKHAHLFAYVKAAIHFLDSHEKVTHFHHIFLLRFTKFLGFFPSGKFSRNEYFDLIEGQFTSLRPVHLNYIEPLEAKRFSELIDAHFGDKLPLSREDSKQLLGTVIEYYHVHLENFGQIKSLKVLEEVFE